MRQPGRGAAVDGTVGDLDGRPASPPRDRIGDEVGAPAALDQGLALGGACVAADEHGSALAGRPGEQDLAGVRVRRARLGEEVVAVVEHRDQAQVGHRRERGTARAQHHLHRAAGHRQELPDTARPASATR